MKTFGAYLPQSLSDNILVSHKSQALQCHSKKGQGVRRRTHREKEKRVNMTQEKQHTGLPAFTSAPQTAQTLTQRPHKRLSEAPCTSAKHSGCKRAGLPDKDTGVKFKGLFHGCHRRFRGGRGFNNNNNNNKWWNRRGNSDFTGSTCNNKKMSPPLLCALVQRFDDSAFYSHNEPPPKQLIWFPDCGSSWLPPRLDGQHICPMN